MISVVCVYNNEKTLKDVLLKSLEKQTVEFELITIDNRYRSAAEVLNCGGAKTKGDYIMFVGQDFWLGSNSWLEDAERTLELLPDLGVAGVAGVSDTGGRFGAVRWEGDDNPVPKPEEVQTLDECLLIMPKSVFDRLKFDEELFDGWHCYGADYCLNAAQLGLKSYVLPASGSHSCARENLEELLKYQHRLYMKHRKNFKHVHTWVGGISWLRLQLRSLRQILGPFYLRLFPDLTIRMRDELAGVDTLLDLGCGHHSPLQHCDIPLTVGVELFEPSLQESKRKGIHSQYIKADITRIEFQPESFDAVIAVEVLEHLTKEEGPELLRRMEKWARQKVIITTPNGYLWQNPYEGNPLQEHRSGWSPGELRKFGFRVYGTNGWKWLRGYKTELKYKPAWLWVRISDLTQKVTYRCPGLAYQLLAIRRINKSGKK